MEVQTVPLQKTSNPQPSKASSLELTEDIIRMRAYQLFEEGGYQHGHDLDDWLQAEAEVFGKKAVAQPEQGKGIHKVVAA
jgi:hypothetical protein